MQEFQCVETVGYGRPLTLSLEMTPDPNTIASALCAYLVAHVLAPGVTIGPDSDLAALDIDSVTMVELAMHIEEQFGIEVPVQLLSSEHIPTVRAFAQCAITQGRKL